jgi:hypothetical protein
MGVFFYACHNIAHITGCFKMVYIGLSLKFQGLSGGTPF